MEIIAFVLNIPWTIVGIFFALVSIPRKVRWNKNPPALVCYVKSFWWYRWLPGQKYARGMAIGHVVLLSPRELPKDLEHELIHVEQAVRLPFVGHVVGFYCRVRYGYRESPYEKEAYERSGSVYIEREKDAVK